MALAESKVMDQITVSESGEVMVRVRRQVTSGAEVLATTYCRAVLVPGQDLAGVHPRVAAVCAAVWTSDVVEAYRAAQAGQLGR